MGPTRRWMVIAVVAAMLAGCGEAASIGNDPEVDPRSPDAAFFCRAWPEARAAISGESTFDLIGDESVGIETRWDYVDDYMARTDLVVPAAIRADWDRAYAFYRNAGGVFKVAGFDEGAIHPIHLEMAFGEAGPEAAQADTEAAIAAIDDWALSECWDFCSQWPELEGILHVEPGEWPDLEHSIDRYEAALDTGDALVPPELSRYWSVATGYVRSNFDFARASAFDQAQAGEDFEAAFSERFGMSVEETNGVIGEAVGWISEWVDANCDATVATAGAPGSVTVRMVPQDGLVGKMVLLALLPAGTIFATMSDTEPVIALACADTDIAPEDFEAMKAEMAPQAREHGMDPESFVWHELGEHLSRPLLPPRQQGEYHEAQLCNLMEHEEVALVPGGNYELFAGLYIGDPGSYDVYLAAPERCAQIPIAVNGDTVVDLPELTPCDMQAVGSAEEIARRPSPAADAAASLHLQVDSAIRPEGYEFCLLRAAALPAGTTLNDVGRGEAWPSALLTFNRPSEEEVDLQGEARRSAFSPGLVPFLQAPLSGAGEGHLGPSITPNGPWDDRFPDPVPLLNGRYDVRVEQLCIENEAEWDEQAEREGRRCAMVTVEVDGATIVEMPELGACP